MPGQNQIIYYVIFGQNRAASLQFNTPDAVFIFSEVYTYQSANVERSKLNPYSSLF